MSDEWLDEQVRTAFEGVVLPKAQVERFKRQAARQRPSSGLLVAVVLLAAAIAVAIVVAWPQGDEPEPSPANVAPVPRPLPRLEVPRVPPLPRLAAPVPVRPPDPPGPAPAPPPVPAPAPSTGPALDMRGLWVGSTDSTRSFKLTVLGQGGADFEGIVEVQLQNGNFDSLSIEGRVDGQGAFTFEGSALRCEGQVKGRKATGTCTLEGRRMNFTAYGSR